MLRYIFDEILSLFNRRSRKQSRSVSIIETLFIYCSSAFVFFGFFGETVPAIPAGGLLTLSLGAASVFLGAIWFAFTRRSEFKINIISLWFLPVVCYSAYYADGKASREILLLASVFFLWCALLKFRRDVFIVAFVFSFCAVLAGMYGLRSFSFSKAALSNVSVSEAQIGAGFMGSISSLSMLLCSSLAMLLASFVAKRFSSAARILAISMFSIVWYSIFKTNNNGILALASIITIFSVFSFSVPSERKFFGFWLLLLVAGTWIALYAANTSDLICEISPSDIVDSYGRLSTAGFLSSPAGVAGNASGTASGAVDYLINFGLLGGALLFAAIIRIGIRAVRVFMKIPMEKWPDGRIRFMWQKRDKVFNRKHGGFYDEAFTPIERIFEGGSMAAFFACILIFAFADSSSGFRTLLVFTIVCALLLRTLSSRKEISKFVGLSRCIGSICLLAVASYAMSGAKPYWEHFRLLPKKYTDISNSVKYIDTQKLDEMVKMEKTGKDIPLSDFEKTSDIPKEPNSVLDAGEKDNR